jgi:Uma2 family endonuclease
MSPLQAQPLTNTWIAASWDEYLQLAENPIYEQAKGYYYRGHLRLEMLPVGFDHGTDHTMIAFALNLFCMCRGIRLMMSDSCSYRKAGAWECQPDLSCYVGDRAQTIPKTTNIVDLDRYPPPDLAIEIAKTTLLDDLGAKRSLYEEMRVAEYWVVDVQQRQIIAYQVGERGSQRLDVSQVLPGFTIATLEVALRRARETDQSTIGAWLLTQFQQP